MHRGLELVKPRYMCTFPKNFPLFQKDQSEGVGFGLWRRIAIPFTVAREEPTDAVGNRAVEGREGDSVKGTEKQRQDAAGISRCMDD
jgi:hypothetical protein